MDTTIIATYCVCDELLQAVQHHTDAQCKMTDAEVRTTAFVAAFYFRGNLESARMMLQTYGYIPQMFSKSRLNRRLHQLQDLLLLLFRTLGTLWKTLNSSSRYVIDSFPIAACDNIRIPRAKLYQPEQFRGYIASKKRYFYGLKLHVMVTQDGQPVEFFLTPGGFGDVDALKVFGFDLPPHSIVYADKAYNDYEIEDVLQEASQVHLLPMRKKNSKRALSPWAVFVQHYYRKRVETVGSLLERLLPKSIHAVTSQGFALKVALFIVAYSLYFCLSEI